MKERPIIFSAPMVRAILDGTKTQTRRIMKPQPTHDAHGIFWKTPHDFSGVESMSPYGQPGDRLWCKEGFGVRFDEEIGGCVIYYRAGGEKVDMLCHTAFIDEPGTFRRPQMMRKWASRITLEIVSIRVERLQDISEEDALAEGVEQFADGSGFTIPAKGGKLGSWKRRPEEAFADLWESIHGDGSWTRNDWVWVVEFKRVEGGAA